VPKNAMINTVVLGLIFANKPIKLQGTFSRKEFLDYHFKWWIRSKLRHANTLEM
jgi:hypothetical protein